MTNFIFWHFLGTTYHHRLKYFGLYRTILSQFVPYFNQKTPCKPLLNVYLNYTSENTTCFLIDRPNTVDVVLSFLRLFLNRKIYNEIPMDLLFIHWSLFKTTIQVPISINYIKYEKYYRYSTLYLDSFDSIQKSEYRSNPRRPESWKPSFPSLNPTRTY